jgi:hypothetical protein
MRCTVLVVVAVLTTNLAHAQGSFEGVVTYQITGKNGTPMTFDYYAKGNKARWQPHDSSSTGGAFGAMIIDKDAKTRTVVIPSRQMYLTSPLTDKMSAHMDSSTRNSKLVKVGSETVAGIPCDDYTVTDATTQKTGTVCIAHGMGDFALMGMGSPLARFEQRVQGLSDAAAGGFFPLKFTGDNDNLIATSVQRKSVDAALFAPPAGYAQMQMPAGMGKP